MSELTMLLAGLALVLLVATIVLTRRLSATRVQLNDHLVKLGVLEERYQPIADVRAEAERVRAEMEGQRAAALADLAAARDGISSAKAEAAEVAARTAQLRAELQSLDEEANLRSFGFYRPHYDFADSKKFADRLEEIREAQKQMLKDDEAATCTEEWKVDGSRAKGRQMTDRQLRLMLRAFNGESDAAIAKVKYNNVGVMEGRIARAGETINKLGETQKCTISKRYVDLKLQELWLAHEYEEKRQAEKEEQRRIKEQMREEEAARRELEKAQADADREERRYEEALRKAKEEVERAAGAKQEKLAQQIEDLEQRLAEAHEKKERAMSRAQMTKSGHVYVISNIGSFGEGVFKIGMTRRLDPFDRIRELGDASVPFEFDVHGVIWSEDAPGLEAELHRAFADRRINRVNERKEFFRVSIDAIASTVREHDAKIELTLAAEAAEYRKTLAILEEERRALMTAVA